MFLINWRRQRAWGITFYQLFFKRLFGFCWKIRQGIWKFWRREGEGQRGKGLETDVRPLRTQYCILSLRPVERDSRETWKNVHSEFSGRGRVNSSVTGREFEPMALFYLWTNQRMDLLPEIWENTELWSLWNYESSHADHCQCERGDGFKQRWRHTSEVRGLKE